MEGKKNSARTAMTRVRSTGVSSILEKVSFSEDNSYVESEELPSQPTNDLMSTVKREFKIEPRNSLLAHLKTPPPMFEKAESDSIKFNTEISGNRTSINLPHMT